MPATHLALLRGINVGGKNMLPMKTLVGLFEKAGCGSVRTHIQSGNVLIEADARLCTNLAETISSAVERSLGFRPPVVLRTAAELADVVANNPFLKTGETDEGLHVLFLADRPTARRIAALDPARSTPDRFIVRGGEVYLHLPDGVAHTRLTNVYFDTKLATISTGRNWRTVTKLLELMGG